MDLEEMLNPEGEHRSGIQTHTDKEIVEPLQGINLDAEVTDNGNQEDKMHIVTCKEALDVVDSRLFAFY